jgi:hypothetical protein
VAVMTFLTMYFETGKGYASIMHTFKILYNIDFLNWIDRDIKPNPEIF